MTRTRKEEEEKLAHDIDPEEVKIVSNKSIKELEESGIKLDVRIDHEEENKCCASEDCCKGSHARWMDAKEPSIDGEIIVGYALDEGEDYSFLDPEPLTGYTLLEEIKFCLYGCQAELKRLEKLIETYEDVSRLQR